MLKALVKMFQVKEDRKAFFLLIATIYPTLDWRYKLIEKAYNDAKDAFRDKFRDSGERYFEHLRGVALILIAWLGVTDHRLIVVALLHDIVEDCHEWTIERVHAEYGEEVTLLVEWMTKPDPELFGGKKDEAERVYHERFEHAPREFFILKMADRLHNLITLWGCTEKKRVAKLVETRLYYLPWARKHTILYREMLEAIEFLETGEKIL